MIGQEYTNLDSPISDLDRTRFLYNCYDSSYTLQIAEVLEKQLTKQPETLQNFYKFQQEEVAPAIMNLMKRGVRVDQEKKEELLKSLSLLMDEARAKLSWLVGEEFNPNSVKQVKSVFVDLLGIEAEVNKKSGNATFGSMAMVTYLEKYPMYKPFLTLLLEYRSLKVFVSTFLSSDVDDDGRMRCSYNIAGTSTYRLSSRKNAFGNGMNLANVPSKGKIDLRYSLEEVDSEEVSLLPETYGSTQLPNCKQLFIPDEGYTFFDVDFSGADAMIVAWDSDCKWLINFFTTQTKKLYIYIGEMYLKEPMTEKHPMYKSFKQFIHLTNYGGGYDKAGEAAGIPRLEAKRLQEFYFKLCPEIPRWHKRIEREVKTRGYIENIFGARGYFLDKNDHNLLNKAYAWLPQSSIAILVNKGIVSMEREAEQLKHSTSTKQPIEVLLQVHDSAAGQFRTTDLTAPDRIIEHMRVELPYNPPLVIPVDIATSPNSYGDC